MENLKMLFLETFLRLFDIDMNLSKKIFFILPQFKKPFNFERRIYGKGLF